MDFSKALKALSDEAPLRDLDLETLGKTLFNTTLLEGLGSSDHLSLVSDFKPEAPTSTIQIATSLGKLLSGIALLEVPLLQYVFS